MNSFRTVVFLSRNLFSLITIITMVSCGSSSRVVTTNKENQSREQRLDKKESVIKPERNSRTYEIIETARAFEGVRYKYGGSNRKGMDCSGLIYVSFLSKGINLPRTSRDMSLQGKRLYLDEVLPGDLLFFETNKNQKVINHVGLVVEISGKNILFIHSSTSKGVIISSLSENYWKNNFVMARRVI